jgi:glutathione synthase
VTKRKVAFIMDPLSTIHPKKDTTFALMLEAQKRHWDLYYLTCNQLTLYNQNVVCKATLLKVSDRENDYFEELGSEKTYSLNDFDIVFMRKDPPVDERYLYTTYLLDLAKQKGAFIINDPEGIRNANEKLLTTYFPQCCPETLVTCYEDLIIDFLGKHSKVIIKPLGQRGGQGIFLLTQNDPNLFAAIQLLTANETLPIMAQRFIPEILIEGDKRILVLDGEPYPYALARIPKPGDIRGNLSQGASYKGVEINERDRWIVSQINGTLKSLGLYFVGIDIIGGWLTEINVTSPTCVREIDKLFNVNVSQDILDMLEKKISTVSGDKPCVRPVDNDN